MPNETPTQSLRHEINSLVQQCQNHAFVPSISMESSVEAAALSPSSNPGADSERLPKEVPVESLVAPGREILQNSSSNDVPQVESKQTPMSQSLQDLCSKIVTLRSFEEREDSTEKRPHMSRGDYFVCLQLPSINSMAAVRANTSNNNKYLRSIARKLVCLDRIIPSINDEINGTANSGGSTDTEEFEDDLIWYEESLESLGCLTQLFSQSFSRRKANVEDEPCKMANRAKVYTNCKENDTNGKGYGNGNAYTERWIDNCLDACGFDVSLDVAVECLRQIVSTSSKSKISSPSDGLSLTALKRRAEENPQINDSEEDEVIPGIVALVTSLRIIRRRLLELPDSSLPTSNRYTMINSDAAANDYSILQNSARKHSPLLFPDTSDFLHKLFLFARDVQNTERIHDLLNYTTLPLEHWQHFHLSSHVTNAAAPILSASAPSSHIFDLAELITSSIPSLVSSACHAMNLPLPYWASTKHYRGMLIHRAWRTALAGDLLSTCINQISEIDGQTVAESLENFENEQISQSSQMDVSEKKECLTRAVKYDSKRQSVTSQLLKCTSAEFFQSIARRMILFGHIDVAVHFLHGFWKFGVDKIESRDGSSIHRNDIFYRSHITFNKSPAFDRVFKSPRSILGDHVQRILSSIPSKRDVAKFILAVVRDIAKKKMINYAMEVKVALYFRQDQQLCQEFDEVCKNGIIDFLQDIILSSLAQDVDLREAFVNVFLLSQPSSLQWYPKTSTDYKTGSNMGHLSFPIMSSIDRAVPLCLAQLLSLACGHSEASKVANGGFEPVASHNMEEVLHLEYVSDDRDDPSDDKSQTSPINPFLRHLVNVSSIWSEDIFVTRTDLIQQQIVTEFLLYPLIKKQFARSEIQTNAREFDTSFASLLLRGISRRLGISRELSVRMDGMRVAEALASLLGQTLSFDELHPLQQCVDDKNELENEIRKEKDRNLKISSRDRTRKMKHPTPIKIDPEAEYSTEDSDSFDDLNDSSSQSENSINSSGDLSSSNDTLWGEDSLEAYAIHDGEEDLRRIPPPRSLRQCVSYLVVPDNDTLAYEKHIAALTELKSLIMSRPLDLLDMTPTLVRVLLHLENKFCIEKFEEMKEDSLMAFGLQAPVEMCICLVKEMGAHVSLGTRLEALSILSGVAQELSGVRQMEDCHAMSKKFLGKNVEMCTRLRQGLGLFKDPGSDHSQKSSESAQSNVISKTRRWRQRLTPPATVSNRFGPISAQMVYCLLAFIYQTKGDTSIWFGAVGEKFLTEFLRALSVMVDCARTYPNSHVLARDLFQLAWSFHDASCSEVRRSVLVALATSASMVPMEFLLGTSSNIPKRLVAFLQYCSLSDCQNLALLMIENM